MAFKIQRIGSSIVLTRTNAWVNFTFFNFLQCGLKRVSLENIAYSWEYRPIIYICDSDESSWLLYIHTGGIEGGARALETDWSQKYIFEHCKKITVEYTVHPRKTQRESTVKSKCILRLANPGIYLGDSNPLCSTEAHLQGPRTKAMSPGNANSLLTVPWAGHVSVTVMYIRSNDVD